MAEKPEDLNLPTAVVGRLIKEVVRKLNFVFLTDLILYDIYTLL